MLVAVSHFCLFPCSNAYHEMPLIPEERRQRCKLSPRAVDAGS